MGYYNFKLTYKYKNREGNESRYFGTVGTMQTFIDVGAKTNFEFVSSEAVGEMTSEIEELVASDILNGTNKNIKCEIGPIHINAIKENREIRVSGIDRKSKKPINLFSKKFIKLRKLLSKKGLITPGKNNEVIVSLNKQIYDTIDTFKKVNNIYGYCRVSTKGQLENNSLEQQQEEIKNRYNNAKCYEESYTGKTMDRPVFNKLLEELEQGDILVVSKLDRLCRSTREGLEVIQTLKEKGVSIHILNMGLIEDTAMGNLIITNLLAFAEFERAMIVERTQTGKAIAKTKDDFREGRPKKYTKKQIDHALSLLSINGGDKSYKEVEELTNISKSTLIRAMRRNRREY